MANQFSPTVMAAVRPTLSRSDSASSSSTISTASSSSSSSSSSCIGRSMSPFSIGGSPVKLDNFTQNITMTDEKEGYVVVKSRPFDWSPLPWTYTEMPFDWWLKRVDRELEAGMDKLDGYHIQVDTVQQPHDHHQQQQLLERGSSDGNDAGQTADFFNDCDVANASQNSGATTAAAVHVDGCEGIEDDDCGFYICEEPEEMEQEYDSRGRPILKLLTKFKGGYGLDSTTSDEMCT
ncbi:hypothetical protein V1509DRAFT_628551 [Lipomyces kononenkoae]